MTPLQQILQVTLNSVQKLLIDPRINEDVNDPGYDNNPYRKSQFKHIYDDGPKDLDDSEYDPDRIAYNSDKSRRPYKDDPDGEEPFYPLTMNETLDLQDVRIIDYIQLGFVPFEDIEKYEKPSLFIANATDRQRLEPADVTLNQVEEVIPLNFRLVTKQPENYVLDQTNIVVVDKVLEGLKYVLNPKDYINLSFPRRGYDQPTVIRKIEFNQALNLEEFFSPYEVVDYLFRITVREQNLRKE